MANRLQRTSTARLATFLLKQDVVEWAAQRRAEGLSYHRIALELRDRTKGQVEVTDETVRLWVRAAA